MQLKQYKRFFSILLLIYPSVAKAGFQMGLDLNGDGLIQLSDSQPGDRTYPDKPFVFWINQDQDDLDESETWPVERPDHYTEVIDSVKDLEDFYPLRLDVPKGTNLASLTFTFSLLSDESPRLNLFLAADGSCTNQHLLDDKMAALQLSEPYRVRLAEVNQEAPVVLTGASLSTTADTQSACLLLEGASAGSGTLQLTVQGADINPVSPSPLHIDLRDIKALYQRTRIDWPETIGPAWTYTDRQPPDPQLQWVLDAQGVKFDPPWYEDEHVIVWVYGWQKEGEAGYHSATVRGGETIFKRLWHRGFRGRLVFLHWPTVKPKLGYGLFQSEYRAYKSGPALKDLVAAQPEDRNVHVTAHSLGNVVLLEALKLGMRPADAMFQVGAISASAVDPREALTLPEMQQIDTPDAATEFGYRGYLAANPTPLYNMYNPTDHTWIGWNLAQHLMKPTHEKGARYRYHPEAPLEERYALEYRVEDQGGWASRTVTDPHEVMAFIARSKSHPIGGEARIGGPVEHVFDIGRPPYGFGHGHTVGWSWPPQRTTKFFNLLLDAFNIAHKSPQR